MSDRIREIHEEADNRNDIYPVLGDLTTLGNRNTEKITTLSKILNDPEDYNIANIETIPAFTFECGPDFVYHSDQWDSQLWPIQTKLDADPGFYDILEYSGRDKWWKNKQTPSLVSTQSHEHINRNIEVEEDSEEEVLDKSEFNSLKNPADIPLRVLDIERDILDDSTVVLIGRRRSGKSWTARWLMYHLRHRFPCGVVITGTKLNSFWSQYIPDDFVHELEDMNIVIDRVFRRQKYLLEHPELGIDPRMFFILDDVLSDKYFIQYSPCLSKCFTDGRHHKIFLLITTQDPRGLPPTLRENTDCAIVFRQFQRGRKEAVCEDFFDYIENKELAKFFLWEKTKSIDLEGNVLEEAVGDDEEIPVPVAVLQSKTTNNLQEIFKLCPSHDPGDFIIGDIDYWKAMISGNWRAVMESMEVFERRSKQYKPRYTHATGDHKPRHKTKAAK